MTKPIDRRTLLRAAGVTIALPLLESMQPALGSAGPRSPRRMVTVCSTLGLYAGAWFPQTEGRDYETTEYLARLKNHRSRYTLFSGLSHKNQRGLQPHQSEATWLTAAQFPGGDGFRNTISLDQLAANHVGQLTRFPSIVLSTKKPESQSYDSYGVMIPAEASPAKLFARMFFQGTPQETAREVRRLKNGGSVLDVIREQTTSLRRRVSDVDQRTLDAYLEAVRGLERDLAASQVWATKPKPVVKEPPPIDTTIADLVGRLQLLFRLIPLILETDSSRVVTVVIQDQGAVPTIPGVSTDQHNLSHHGQDPAKIAQLKKIESEIVGAFAGLLTNLTERGDASGSLLDRTTVLLGSNLGNANAHFTWDLPILVAGGSFRHGQHIVHKGPENAPLSNLFLSLLQEFGMETESFGQSTGRMTWS